MLKRKKIWHKKPLKAKKKDREKNEKENPVGVRRSYWSISVLRANMEYLKGPSGRDRRLASF